jgi:hypothetical protein
MKDHPNFTARLNNWTKGKNGMGGCTVDIGTGSDGCLTTEELDCYYSYSLGKSREKLNASIADIYNPQNSISATYDSNYHTTMLTGIVWAMLGTTVLYYAFTKM